MLYSGISEKKKFRVTVSVEKFYLRSAYFSEYLLQLTFLTLTYRSRHKIFPEHPEKDAWVEIWHHHLEKVRTKLSENLKMFLIGQWEKDSNRQMVKMQRTFQNHQSNDGCSNFFNLKPNAGHENTIQYQHAKIEKIFWSQVTALRTHKELAA